MKNFILFLSFIFLLSCGQDNQAQNNKAVQNLQTVKQIEWNDLIPEEFSQDTIIAKYKKQIDKLEDDPSQAGAVYQKIMDEMAEAPMNEKMADKKIKLDGFIAPLTQTNGKISEFLLVPYFGACIHVPPPPANQTIFVKTASGHEIDINDSQLLFQISGKVTLNKASTEIGEAGYSVDNAKIEISTEQESLYE